MDPPGCLHRAQADGEPVQPKFDMLGDALGRSAESLPEAEKIPVEVQSSFDVAGVQIDQGACHRHVFQMLEGYRDKSGAGSHH